MSRLVRPRCSAHHVNDCATVDPNVRSHLYRKAAILPRSRKYSPGAVHGHKVGNCLFVSPTCMIGGCHRCRDQVKILQEKCNFLNQASGSRCANELRDGRICTVLSDSNCSFRTGSTCHPFRCMTTEEVCIVPCEGRAVSALFGVTLCVVCVQDTVD
jgi:hypothetical protein